MEQTVIVEGIITDIELTDYYGAEHQKFIILCHGIDYLIIIRFGDKEGLKKQIPVKIGDKVEAKGELIQVSGKPAVHFTHHPIGYIIVNEHKYE